MIKLIKSCREIGCFQIKKILHKNKIKKKSVFNSLQNKKKNLTNNKNSYGKFELIK